MPDDAGISSLPFDVAPEVAELAGLQELRTLARMADAGPFDCLACEREGTASKATATAVVVTFSGRPPGKERMMMRLAHRSCLASQIFVSEGDMTLQPETDVTAVAALLRGSDGPQPVLLLDFWTALTDPGTGPDGGTDLVVSNLLRDGMTLATDIFSPLPPASGFSARVGRRTVAIHDPHGRVLLAEAEVITPPGWRRAIKKAGEITVHAGSGLGLGTGNLDGAVEVARLGHLVGGRVSVRRE